MGSSLSPAPHRPLRRCRRVRTAALLLLAGVVLVTPPVARAGGDFVDLAVGSSRVWFVGEAGVRELDARSGRTLSMPQLVGTPYPLSVTLAGGAAWVASVENGYVWGTLSRIDLRSGRVHLVWRKQDSSVQYVAAGAGSVWALIGSGGSTEIGRFSLNGRLARVWKITDAGRMAADRSGCWISTDRLAGTPLRGWRHGHAGDARTRPDSTVATPTPAPPSSDQTDLRTPHASRARPAATST